MNVPADVSEAAAVVILMHGRNSSSDDMRGLAQAINLPRLHFILPDAPGHAWYPQSFLAPLEANEPALSRSLGQYDAIVESLTSSGVPYNRIVIGGFSQGACLTCEFLIRTPRRYGAAIILTGGLIGPPGTEWPRRPELEGMRIYMSSSEIDPFVPAWRFRESELVFRESGAEVRSSLLADRPHTVSSQEIQEVRRYLSQYFPGV